MGNKPADPVVSARFNVMIQQFHGTETKLGLTWGMWAFASCGKTGKQLEKGIAFIDDDDVRSSSLQAKRLDDHRVGDRDTGIFCDEDGRVVHGPMVISSISASGW